MRFVAIISEFNPLHNGHAYILKETRRLFPDHGIIVIMSGNFVQRGDVAVFEKHIRANHALLAGADAVVELPFPFCSANSEHFAVAAVKLIKGLNAVDALVFGSECGDTERLIELERLTRETPELSKLIKKNCKSLSYPAAMEKSLIELGVSDKDINAAFLPNNALAIQYIRALNRLAPNVRAVTVKRLGEAYGSENTEADYPSAMAVRGEIFAGRVSKNIPFYVQKDVENAFRCRDFGAERDRFFRLLQGASLNVADFGDYFDCDRDLAVRFSRAIFGTRDLDSFLKEVKNKRYTMARIKRVALYVLMNVTNEMYGKCMDCEMPLNVLALRDGNILKELRENASCAVITGNVELTAQASPVCAAIIRANTVYAAITGEKAPSSVVFLIKNAR